jgi:AbrB family looped-hinge helix DNA binding protein
MRLRTKVGPKGQVVIPKEVRDILGIAPGNDVVFEVADKEARIKPVGTGSTLSELTEIIPKKDKLSKDVDVKKLLLSEQTTQSG